MLGSWCCTWVSVNELTLTVTVMGFQEVLRWGLAMPERWILWLEDWGLGHPLVAHPPFPGRAHGWRLNSITWAIIKSISPP